MVVCPYCGDLQADGMEAEIAHMNEKHADIIESRMLAAGFRRGPDGEWIDCLSGAD